MIHHRFIEMRMQEQKISYRAMAQKLNFKSPATFWKWVHGRTQIKAVYLERLAEILDVPVQNFFIKPDGTQKPCNGGDCDEI